MLNNIGATVAGHVLIADDDEPFLLRLERALARRGFRTAIAASVAEGLAQVAQDPPKYAVVDLRLGDGSGLDIIEALRQARPDARAIVLTGYGNTPTAVAAVKLGAIDYLAKPEGADEIVAALLAPEGCLPAPPDDPITPDAARLSHIEHVFNQCEGNVSQAARMLNMHRRTLQRILKRDLGRDTEDAANLSD
ncbi:MAG: response regulator [Rhodobacteraceae bacterium]|nr:response regulator [Paracoccaceae bacterium]